MGSLENPRDRGSRIEVGASGGERPSAKKWYFSLHSF